jgi:hypothetical protein
MYFTEHEKKINRSLVGFIKLIYNNVRSAKHDINRLTALRYPIYAGTIIAVYGVYD